MEVERKISYSRNATLPPTPGETKSFNRETISEEITFTYSEEEGVELDMATEYEKLKARVDGRLSWKGGNPSSAATAQDRTPNRPIPPKGNGQSRGSVDWDNMYCKWSIPYKECDESTRNALKSCGCRFRGKKNRDGSFNADGDNCWYAPEPIPGTEHLKKYQTIINPIEGEVVTDDGMEDELPF